MKTRFLGKLALVLFLLGTMVACGNAVDLEEEITPEDAPVNGDMDQQDVIPNEDESLDEDPMSEDSETETNIEENSNTEEPALNDVEPEESLNSEELDPEMEEVK